MSTSEALAAWRLFLETTPANTSKKISGLVIEEDKPLVNTTWTGFDTPEIQLYCKSDHGYRRFAPSCAPVQILSVRHYHLLEYICRDCQEASKTFAVLIILESNDGDVEVMKLGEYPPFSAPISSRIQKLLSPTDLEFYRQGVRAEGQGFGIGAATYFRRVVEKQWKLLVNKIRQAAEKLGEHDLSIYDRALQETQFSKAVDMLKDQIPEKLLILQGENPLTLLYQPLSKQLHGLTDEECLQQAADIRKVLTALLENIADALRDQAELHEAAGRLRDSKQSPTD